MPRSQPRRLIHLPLVASLLAMTLASAAPAGVSFAGPAPVISATLTATNTSANNDGKAEPGDTISYALSLTNTGSGTATGVTISDAPGVDTALVPNSLVSSPIARPDSYGSLPNVGINVPDSAGVLANDTDPTGESFTVTQWDSTSTNGGTISGTDASGGFTYTPAPGFAGNDTFHYTTSNGKLSGVGTVTITVSGTPVWFVNSSAAAGGNGTLANPFNSLSAFTAVNHGGPGQPKAGDALFLYSGSYTGPLPLLSNQSVVGAGAPSPLASLLNLTVPQFSVALPATGGTNPTVGLATNDNSNLLSLHGNNLLVGFDLSDTTGTGTALVGTDSGTLTINGMSVTDAKGTAIDLNGENLAVTLKSVSSGTSGTSASYGIKVQNTTGSFTVTGGSGSTADGSGGTLQYLKTAGAYFNNAGTVALNHMTINGIGGLGTQLGNTDIGVQFLNGASSAMNVDLESSTIQNTGGDAVMAEGSGPAQLNVKIGKTAGDTLQNAKQAGIEVIGRDAAQVRYDIENNTVGPTGGTDIATDEFQTSSDASNLLVGGTINGNTIGQRGVAKSGNTGGGDGIQLWANSAGQLNAAVTNNHVYGITGIAGINIESANGNPHENVTLNGNVVDVDNAEVDGLFAENGSGIGEASTLCLDAGRSSADNLTDSVAYDANNGEYAMVLAEETASAFTLPGYGGSGSDPNAVASFEAGHNGVSASQIAALPDYGSFSGGSSCTAPPTLPSTPSTRSLRSDRTMRTAGKWARTTPRRKTPAADGHFALDSASLSPNTSFSLGDIPAGVTVSLTFQTTVQPHPSTDTQSTNTVTVSGSNISDTTAQATTQLGLLNSSVAVGIDPNPAVAGQTITLSATVTAATGSGTPTGSVTFYDGSAASGTNLGSGTLSSSGVAQVTASFPATPSGRTITAVYGGDTSFNGASNTGSVVINQADSNTTTTVTAPGGAVQYGTAVTFTATVAAKAPGSGTPTGAVNFTTQSGPIAACQNETLDSNGKATCTTSSLPVGDNTINAAYLGDSNFNPSSDPTGAEQVVNKADTSITTSSSNSSPTFGDVVTFTASVTISASAANPPSAPTGTVTFTDITVPAAPVVLGTASLRAVSGTPGAATAKLYYSSLPAGPHKVAASYEGDGNYNSSADSSGTSVTIAPSTTVSASKTGTTDGTSVTVVINGTNLGDPGSYGATATGGSAGDDYLTVESYLRNPTGHSLNNGGNFFDVKVSPGNTFSHLTIEDCNLMSGANTLSWFDQSQSLWKMASPLTGPTNGCITFQATRAADANASSPTIEQLTGTVFGTNTSPTRTVVSALRVTHHTRATHVSWHVASSAGIVGFNLTSGGATLNKHLIAVHASATYNYTVHRAVRDPIVLHTLWRGGGETTNTVG